MASAFGALIRREKTAERDGFLEPALVVSIAIAIFAVVTQCLAATGAISLSATQQLTMWLVAAGLIVLLWIAYMAVKAQAEAVKAQTRMAEAVETARTGAERAAAAAREAAEEQVARAQRDAAAAQETAREQVARAQRETAAAHETAREQVARAQREAGERVAEALRERDNMVVGEESGAAGAESGDAWVPPGKLRRLDGSKRSVSTAEVFPNGCFLVPGSISETPDYDDTTGTRLRVYQCRVVDSNPALEGRSRETAVQILADQIPVAPTGLQFEPVKFEDLQVTPYVSDKGQMGFLLRAKGIESAVNLAANHTEDGRDGRR